MMSKPMLTLTHAGVRYKVRNRLFSREYFWPLEDISLQVNRGETVGVVGRNGAGKTSLLRLMAGIIAPDRGTVETDDISALMLSIQVGFQPHLTGRENIIQSGLLLGLSTQQILNKMDEIIDFAEIDSHIDKPMRTYSLGMRARLGFAVASQAEPDLLLIDEVLGVGDAEFAKKSREYILKRIASDETVVIVSHHADTLRQYCDRLMWVEQGKTQMVGDVEGVLQAYLQK